MTLWLAGACPAAAQPACDGFNSTQMDLNACYATTARTADAALNSAYGAVVGRLSAESRIRLRDAQRAWIAFRDKECAFVSSGLDGGSVAPMIVSQCAAGLTDQRTAALKALQNCQEGDLSCPR